MSQITLIIYHIGHKHIVCILSLCVSVCVVGGVCGGISDSRGRGVGSLHLTVNWERYVQFLFLSTWLLHIAIFEIASIYNSCENAVCTVRERKRVKSARERGGGGDDRGERSQIFIIISNFNQSKTLFSMVILTVILNFNSNPKLKSETWTLTPYFKCNPKL